LQKLFEIKRKEETEKRKEKIGTKNKNKEKGLHYWALVKPRPNPTSLSPTSRTAPPALAVEHPACARDPGPPSLPDRQRDAAHVADRLKTPPRTPLTPLDPLSPLPSPSPNPTERRRGRPSPLTQPPALPRRAVASRSFPGLVYISGATTSSPMSSTVVARAAFPIHGRRDRRRRPGRSKPPPSPLPLPTAPL
jgi:hypothetical protein